MGLRTRYGWKYGYILFLFHFTVTILWIVDRLTTNYWPRESFNEWGLFEVDGKTKMFASGKNPGTS